RPGVAARPLFPGDARTAASRHLGAAPRAHIDELAGDRGRSSHRGTHEMGAAATPLPPLEVAIGSGGATLPDTQHVGIHAEAHRTAGVAPFEAGLAEHAIQYFPLRFPFDEMRPGNAHRTHARSVVQDPHDAGRRAELLDVSI